MNITRFFVSAFFAALLALSLSACRSSGTTGGSSDGYIKKPTTIASTKTSQATENKGYWLVGGEDDEASAVETAIVSPKPDPTRSTTLRIPSKKNKPAPVSTPVSSKSGEGLSAERMQEELRAFKSMARPGEYALDKGDTVIIHLQGIPDPETVEDIVDANGMITLPLIDEVNALGMSSRQIESSIKSKYVPDYYRNINITVLVPTKSYYVEGKVKDPGKFQLRGVVKVMQAIAEAGGVDEFAHKWKVTVTRGDQVIMLDRRTVKEKPSLDLELQPGDRIFVHASVL